jgi:hypothetical protein
MGTRQHRASVPLLTEVRSVPLCEDPAGHGDAEGASLHAGQGPWLTTPLRLGYFLPGLAGNNPTRLPSTARRPMLLAQGTSGQCNADILSTLIRMLPTEQARLIPVRLPLS